MNPLKQWLEMSMDWPFTHFHGRLGQMRGNYFALMPEYLSALERAEPEHLREYDMEIFESLFFAVEADDADAIRRVYAACPELSRSGHFDGLTPLGSAIEEGKFRALRALLDSGFDPDANSLGFGEDTITQLLWSDYFREDVLFELLQAGAYLEPKAVAQMVLEEKEHLIPRAARLARDFDGQVCYDWIAGDGGLTGEQLQRLGRILLK